ncbi:alpha/beta fold hydrolase [Bacterioplanoides sp.]|uniref:alpha/beta fold hydrolase n=1 Tax=Bacterioplanoides sp. TaxID=2066072 RepID=UPI003B5BA0A2
MRFGKLISAAGLILTLAACSTSQQDSLLQTVVEMGRDAASLEIKTSQLDDVNMTYLERQGEGPVMLLLHGFSANKDTWIQFAAELPENYRLIVPDLAGHGDTPAPKGEDYNLIRQAERLNQLMANLNISKFHIAGNSMGGAISAIYASLYPQQVSSLTLIDAAGVDAPNQSEYMAALAEGKNPLIATDEASFEFRMDFVMSKAPPLPWPLRPALMRKTLARQQLNEDIFEDMMATRKQLEDTGFEARLSEAVTMPTLIIWGDEDRVLDVSAVEVFKQKIPHAQVKIYEGIGHLPMVEIPEETAILYSEFVAGAE